MLLFTDLFLRPERTGIDLYCDKLVYWLPRLAPHLDFTLVSLGEPEQRLPSFAPNLKHRNLPVSRRRFYLASMLGLDNPLKTVLSQADLVHLMVPLPIATDKPLLVTVYDLTPLTIPKSYSCSNRLLYRWMFRRLVAQNSHFSVISDRTGEDLHNLFQVPASLIQRVYLGVGEEFRVISDAQQIRQVRTRYCLPDSYFLYIGSMHKRKNLPTLLRAYHLFRAQDTTDTKLVLAGRMSLGGDKLGRQIREQGLEKEIILLGYVASADLPAVIGGATALLYPSLYEGFGLPALEAMACGTPVVASTGGSIPEVTGGHALLCEPLDAGCFCEAMLRIVSETELRVELVKRGLDWATRFSWRLAAEETLQLYDRILGVGNSADR